MNLKRRSKRLVRTISDSSPIIALEAIDRLHLLRDIYGSVTVPPAVATEVKRFRLPHWIDVAPLPAEMPHIDGAIGLGPGETEAICLALTLLPNQILLDDGAARVAARRHGLNVIGVCGILLTAKKLGMLPTIAGDLDRLVATSFRISPRLYSELLVRAGEL
jgi:hypothetical protein